MTTVKVEASADPATVPVVSGGEALARTKTATVKNERVTRAVSSSEGFIRDLKLAWPELSR